MKLSIKDCLHEYVAGIEKTWAHDRGSTVGASEIGQCLRKTWFAKNDAPRDDDYRERYGAQLRGTIIEDHYWVPGLLATLPEGVSLIYAGDEQKTLVDGYLSATPDGLLTGLERDCLKHMGVADIGDSLVVECKSIDPRVDIRTEKPEHSFQTQVQIGLIRHATNWRPDYALISYTDASFLDDVREFAVAFDPAIYQAATARARQVMTADDAQQLPPEGKIAGGDECRYCAWKSHCANVTIAGIPKDDKPPLADNALAELHTLRDNERTLATQMATIEREHGAARHEIKEFLRLHGVARARGDDWSVAWFTARARESIDTKAAEAAGIDLSPFKTTGEPGDRLIVK